MSYIKPVYYASRLRGVTTYEGETLEQKVAKITANKETIKDGAPLLYQEKNEGVAAGYNIRTDRWEVAADAMDKAVKAKAAKSEAKVIPLKKDEAKEPEAKDSKAD